jgi:hypothetical protein
VSGINYINETRSYHIYYRYAASLRKKESQWVVPAKPQEVNTNFLSASVDIHSSLTRRQALLLQGQAQTLLFLIGREVLFPLDPALNPFHLLIDGVQLRHPRHHPLLGLRSPVPTAHQHRTRSQQTAQLVLQNSLWIGNYLCFCKNVY